MIVPSMILQTTSQFSIYLSALRISEGRYFINGNRRLSRDGKYTAAGSVFRYHSRYSNKCPGECILSEGPTTEPVDIMVVSQQPEQNPCFSDDYIHILNLQMIV